MVDRLMPVGSQGSRWQSELPVEVDGRGECEDARGDAADQSVRGSREMALQAELSLSELTIDSMRWRMRPIGGELRSGSFARLGLRSSPPSSATACSKSAPAKPLSAITSWPAGGWRS